QTAPSRLLLCIVGEPTEMRVATGHKGKVAARAVCRGREGHSALAPFALNAIHLGCDFDVPYTTIHAGKINAGVALNIVPNSCEVDFEIRYVAPDDPEKIFDRL